MNSGQRGTSTISTWPLVAVAVVVHTQTPIPGTYATDGSSAADKTFIAAKVHNLGCH